MKYKDIKKNKAYENLGMNEEEVNNLLADCIEKKQELKAGISDLSVRRNEKMKKKEYGDVLKKVAVASLSLVATGAIIAGVAIYKDNTKPGNNSMAAKETTIKETQKFTEKVTEKETEIEIQTLNENEKVKKSHKFGCICTENCDDNGNVIEEDVIASHEKNRLAKHGKYEVMQTLTDPNKKYDIKLKQGDKFKIVDSISMIDEYHQLTLYYYGKNLYYFDNEGLKTLNLKTAKADYVFKYSESGTELVNHSWSSRIDICDIDDSYIYVSGHISTDENDGNDYSYSYDIKNKKLNKINAKCFEWDLRDDLIITKDEPNYMISSEGDSLTESPKYVERKVDGKIETLRKLGDRVWVFTEDNDLSFSKSDNNKFYYISFDKVKQSGYTDYSEVTVMAYNIKTNETEKIDVFTIPNMNIGDKGFWFKEITDGSVKFYYNNEQGHQENGEYNLKTKKLTHKLAVEQD
ncbi:MAG TPA: hypothetical protein DCW44_09015 [Eubacterium sp.]|nr:hypothetical protein [Eubacterium sp.]